MLPKNRELSFLSFSYQVHGFFLVVFVDIDFVCIHTVYIYTESPASTTTTTQICCNQIVLDIILCEDCAYTKTLFCVHCDTQLSPVENCYELEFLHKILFTLRIRMFRRGIFHLTVWSDSNRSRLQVLLHQHSVCQSRC